MQELSLTKSGSDLARRLGRMPLFRALTPRQMLDIAAKGSLRKYEPREVLVNEGERDDTLFLLISGELDILHEGVLVGTIRRLGDVFGEMGLIDGNPPLGHHPRQPANAGPGAGRGLPGEHRRGGPDPRALHILPRLQRGAGHPPARLAGPHRRPGGQGARPGGHAARTRPGQ